MVGSLILLPVLGLLAEGSWFNHLLGPLVSMLILGFMVIVHEAGHFIVARWCGVKVLRFSMGFGPKLLTWKRGDTEYALSAIPLGGYVKMAGEQETAATAKPGDYVGRPMWQRALIVFAGPFVNYLVAFLSLWLVYNVGYPEVLPIVGRVAEDMPAYAAGIQPDDYIRRVNGEPVQFWEEMVKKIHDKPDQPLRLEVERAGAVHEVTVTPVVREIVDLFGDKQRVGMIGVASKGAFQVYRVGPLEAVPKAMHKLNEWTYQTLMALWSMVTGKVPFKDSMTGPIGLVVITSEAVALGIAPVLFLISLFSLSLAIFNVFPIPVLDGGHLLFMALEKLLGRPVSPAVQERAAQVSFFLLITLILVICANDLERFGMIKKLRELVGR